MDLEGVNQSGPDFSRRVKRGLRVQSLTGTILALTLLILGPVEAYSSLFGSLAAFVPALIFTAIVATKFGDDSAAFLRTAVIGEAVKLLLIAIICMAVFIWVKPLAAGWFFTGYISIQGIESFCVVILFGPLFRTVSHCPLQALNANIAGLLRVKAKLATTREKQRM